MIARKATAPFANPIDAPTAINGLGIAINGGSTGDLLGFYGPVTSSFSGNQTFNRVYLSAGNNTLANTGTVPNVANDQCYVLSTSAAPSRFDMGLGNPSIIGTVIGSASETVTTDPGTTLTGTVTVTNLDVAVNTPGRATPGRAWNREGPWWLGTPQGAPTYTTGQAIAALSINNAVTGAPPSQSDPSGTNAQQTLTASGGGGSIISSVSTETINLAVTSPIDGSIINVVLTSDLEILEVFEEDPWNRLWYPAFMTSDGVWYAEFGGNQGGQRPIANQSGTHNDFTWQYRPDLRSLEFVPIGNKRPVLMAVKEPPIGSSPSGLRFAFIGAWGLQPVPAITIQGSPTIQTAPLSFEGAGSVSIVAQIEIYVSGYDSGGNFLDDAITCNFFLFQFLPMPTTVSGKQWAIDWTLAQSGVLIPGSEATATTQIGTFPTGGSSPITGLTLTSAGGYTSNTPPTIVISGGGGADATATAIMTGSGGSWSVGSLTLTAPGSGFLDQSTIHVQFSGGSPTVGDQGTWEIDVNAT